MLKGISFEFKNILSLSEDSTNHRLKRIFFSKADKKPMFNSILTNFDESRETTTKHQF